MASFPTTSILPNAIGTTISHSQLISAGRDVNFHVPSAGLPGLLRHVSNATHTRSGPIARCDPGTRVEVIALIEKWLNGPSKKTAVCWLNGPAGYGKSALSQTIAERYSKKSRLIGSFFFLRGAGDRSHISCLIPTLAHQISISIPATKRLIERAFRDEPNILGTSVAHQFQRLIVDPVRSTSNIFSLIAKSKLVVIDALDECNDKVQMVEFIDVLIDVSRSGELPFRIFLTSRVEEHIRKRFDDSMAQSVLYCLDLGDFDARSDIQVYLEREFCNIYNQNLPVLQWIPQPWPSLRALDLLLNKAGSSFMFAITLIQLVRSSTMPDQALQQVLSSEATGLDPLYKQVLFNASHTPSFDQILGTIMILSDNHSILFLSSLLCLQPQEIVHELLAVQSIVKVPGDDNEPVMLYHTSLRDFLTIQSRSQQYFIDPPMRHIHLALDCLKCLAEDPSDYFFDGDVKRYASLEWPKHVILGFQEQELDVEETITDSLVSLIGNLLTFQGKTWFNTVLHDASEDERKMLERLKAGKALFQTYQGLVVAEKLFKLFQQAVDLYETEKEVRRI